MLLQNIIKYLISELDDFQEQEKDEESLLILCANCRKKHFLGKCPLKDLKVFEICQDGHEIKHFPSLP